jgi:LacI family transcriptional regulator
VNIRKLSALCGMSVCTVSRVLNGRAKQFRIPEPTAQRILTAAKVADFRPNYLAHSLNTGRTYTIGLIFANTVDTYLGSIIEGLDAHLRAAEYQTVVATGENTIALQDLAIRRLMHRHVDGIILYPQALPPGETYSPPEPVGHRKHPTPVVIIGRTLPVERDQVMLGDHAAGVATARYFLESGCQRFVFLTHPTNCSSDRGRQRGFIETLTQAGVPTHRRLVIRESLCPSGAALHKIKSADALFGVNSALLLKYVMAMHHLTDLRRMRAVSVGEVEGAELMRVSLRTWTIPGRKMGEEAGRLLLWRLQHPNAPWRKVEIPLKWTA